MASYQYIYVMKGLSKTYPGGKKTFENIRLNFLPGVKIGVVGVNGSGKSTLLRVMAGWDKDFTGEAWAAQGARRERDRALRRGAIVYAQRGSNGRYALKQTPEIQGALVAMDPTPAGLLVQAYRVCGGLGVWTDAVDPGVRRAVGDRGRRRHKLVARELFAGILWTYDAAPRPGVFAQRHDGARRL